MVHSSTFEAMDALKISSLFIFPIKQVYFFCNEINIPAACIGNKLASVHMKLMFALFVYIIKPAGHKCPGFLHFIFHFLFLFSEERLFVFKLFAHMVYIYTECREEGF